MSWLVDTNVLSELRKGDRAHSGIRAWFTDAREAELFTSVLVLGEIRRGIESIRRRDAPSAMALEQWLERLASDFADRVPPVDARVADRGLPERAGSLPHGGGRRPRLGPRPLLYPPCPRVERTGVRLGTRGGPLTANRAVQAAQLPLSRARRRPFSFN